MDVTFLQPYDLNGVPVGVGAIATVQDALGRALIAQGIAAISVGQTPAVPAQVGPILVNLQTLAVVSPPGLSLGGGGSGTVTHLEGVLTAGQPVIGNGGGDLVAAGWGLAGTAAANYTLPGASATLAGTKPREVTTNANTATYSINSDAIDVLEIEAQTTPITGLTITGTPTAGQPLIINLTGTAANIAIALGAQVEPGNCSLPTTFGTARSTYVLQYNPVTTLWTLVGGGGIQNTFISNTRIKERVFTYAGNAPNIPINTDQFNTVIVSGQTTNITGFTLTGTPNSRDPLVIQIIASATISVTPGSSFENSTISFPTSVASGATVDIGTRYNAITSKFRTLAVA